MGEKALFVCCLAAVGCRSGFEERSPDAGRIADGCIPGQMAADFQTLPEWATPYESGTATFAVGGGMLRIELGAGTSDSVGGIHSPRFELANLRFVVEASEMVDTATDARAYLCVSNCEFGRFNAMMRQQHGTLLVEVAILGGVISARPYDSVGDRYWQARETGGMTFWETSPDGAMWTTLAQYATPTTADVAELWLGAWNNGAASGGSVTFRSFRSCLEP